MASRAAEARARAKGHFPASGLITHFADPAQMEAWMDSALPGSVLVYASGPNLGGGKHPAAVLARKWLAAKIAILYYQRNGDGFRYHAKKLACSVPQRAVGVPDGALPPAWEHAPEGAVLRLLEECAEAGAPCPSNDAIAEQLNLTDRYAARYRFDRLVSAGVVRVIEPNRFTARVIEIAATGARTRASGGFTK